MLALNCERVIFDGGVALHRAKGGFHTHVNSKGGPVPVQPSQLVSAGLRPLLAIIRLPADVPATVLLDAAGRGVRRFSAMGLFERHGFHAFDLEYLSAALVYHLEALARHYETIRDRFREITLIPGASVSKEANYQNQPEPYFEFDAVITAARRAYNSCRYLLWQRWGPSTYFPLPNSFSRTVTLCERLDSNLRDDLTASWDHCGTKLTAYRDCMQHYVPVNFGLATVSMREVLPGVWSASARIPDNPEARSKTAFRFQCRLDALSFAWQVAVEVHRVIDLILHEAYSENDSG